jgi:hypothetical protein
MAFTTQPARMTTYDRLVVDACSELTTEVENSAVQTMKDGARLVCLLENERANQMTQGSFPEGAFLDISETVLRLAVQADELAHTIVNRPRGPVSAESAEQAREGLMAVRAMAAPLGDIRKKIDHYSRILATH